jgi:hypothetical protein
MRVRQLKERLETRLKLTEESFEIPLLFGDARSWSHPNPVMDPVV